MTAAAGDHAAIYHFLNDVFQSPSAAEFKASLEDPFYEPADRLLIRRGNRIVAHAHVTHRVMRFGPVQIPVAGLHWLAIAPDCRGQGLGRHLLASAERLMVRSGALVGLIRTGIPHFFRRTGWALCGRQVYSRADARAVLARLLDEEFADFEQRSFAWMGHAAPSGGSPLGWPRDMRFLRHDGSRQPHLLHIRPWKRWEQGPLSRIYNQNLTDAYGPLQRTDAYWRWLVRRHAYDQIYVALEGSELLELEEAKSRLVGYAVLRGEQIVELQTAPGRGRVALELLARACGDAIEHDRHRVLLQAPAFSPLHALLCRAGGTHHEQPSCHGQVSMARLLDLLDLLQRMCGPFFSRAQQAGLPCPLELGMLVEGEKYQLEIGADEATVVAGRMGRSYLHLNVADFTRLVLGVLDWDYAKAQGRLEVSTQLADQAGRVLFPNVPLWHPPFDDLPA